MPVFIANAKLFKRLPKEVEGKSINDICVYLGYDPVQTHTFFGDFDESFPIRNVIFEVFTANIVAILTREGVTAIDKRQLDFFIRNYSIKAEFDSINTSEILNDGIKKNNLTIEFLARVLNIEDAEPNGVYFIDSLGLYLYFNNGVLTDFRSSDSLNEWAKYLKELNEVIVLDYQKAAELCHSKSSDVLFEINMQAKSWSETPESYSNEFLELHRTPHDTINFFNLLVCHYGKDVNEEIFLKINKGRSLELKSNPEINRYNVGNFIFEFSYGKILNTYSNN